MPHLPSLAADARLLQVFERYRATAKPLLQYHEALMRGPSPLSVAERELIAAYVSGLNQCRYCHGVHAATARAFGVEAERLDALLVDLDGADPKLRPLLAYVQKLTTAPTRVGEADAEAVFAAGWDEDALHDAIAVCCLFNFMNRYVEGLGLAHDDAYAEVGGRRLHQGGYRALLELLGMA